MRIAVAGFGHETNTFSTLRTTVSDFTILRGEECVQGPAWNELGAEVEWAPCLIATAMPNGLVEKKTYLTIKAEILERLKAALPFDGLYLALHGAMHVEEIGDGETDLLRSIRELVGPDLPIAASLDLHGNLSPEFVASVNVLTALRTAPHVDGPETRERTLRHLVRCIQEGKRPQTFMVKLPLLLPGESAVTAIEPSLSLYGHIEELEQIEGVWDASLMIGCAWTDSPYTSVSTLVVGENPGVATQAAKAFADRVWDKRTEFGPEAETIPFEEALQKAVAFPSGPVFVSESGDNVTAGGAGDIPFGLEKMIEAGLDDALHAGIADGAAVKACVEAGVGATIELDLGGKLDAINAKPLKVVAEVLKASEDFATIRIGGVTAIIVASRSPFHTLAAFEPSGVDPLSKKIVVVKQGYLATELREQCSTTMIGLTPGFTDLRIEGLPYHSIVRPIFPLDEI